MLDSESSDVVSAVDCPSVELSPMAVDDVAEDANCVVDCKMTVLDPGSNTLLVSYTTLVLSLISVEVTPAEAMLLAKLDKLCTLELELSAAKDDDTEAIEDETEATEDIIELYALLAEVEGRKKADRDADDVPVSGAELEVSIPMLVKLAEREAGLVDCA